MIKQLIFVLLKLKKCLPEIVKEVEQRAVDGVIDAKDRKAIAMTVVKTVADEFGIKLNFIARIIVSKMIDKLAQKLPSKDVVVPEIVSEVLKAKKKKKSKNNFAK